jgi:DNA-binding response OmpR family regulator
MKAKILLVDDEKEILELLKDFLLIEGFEVLSAQTGSEFRELALSEKPDLIILDIMLGKDNGVAIYNRLLQEGLERTVPVIFLTGLTEDHSESPASPGRTYALRTKPFNPTELVNDIYYLVNH